MNQQEYHLSAVRFWQKANQNLKRFSECCYHVEDKDALAADCVCSVRTIQFYAAAWSLYLELQAEFGETVSLLWERGEISLWRKAPQLRNTLGLSLGKTYEYLETAQVDRVLQKSALTDGLGGVYNAGEKEKERKWKKTTI